MKLTKEYLDKVRHIEGFPIAKDEDIIALSQPPYYTACPNPFIEDFIKEHGKPYDEATDDYHREPFAADISEGKNDPIYNAHTYHTKVPHKAIMRYILHYTEPGDIVFDGFGGTGMTGVAARMCENPDEKFKLQTEREMGNVKWGVRYSILNDISPAASFISKNYTNTINTSEFKKGIDSIIKKCEEDLGWVYETRHIYDSDDLLDNLIEKKGKINYVVMSDVLICPNCSKELVFWDIAVNNETSEVKSEFSCKYCNSTLKKTGCDKAKETIYDQDLNKNIVVSKIIPVLINYTYGKKRYEKKPDKYDFEIFEKIDKMLKNKWYPTNRLPGGKETRRNDKDGITHVHHFYTKRNLMVVSYLYDLIVNEYKKHEFLFVLNAVLIMATKMSRYGKRTGNVSGTLYVPSLVKDLNIIEYIKRKLYGPKGIIKPFIEISKCKPNTSIQTTQSLTCISNISTNSIDYIFTDPPFGSNLNYSELNFIWESWLKVKTNIKEEAIVNSSQKKGLFEYQELMEKCFAEYYRVLKPGRWMTVEFHNSSNSVWNAIQEALLKAGFIVADVRTLDKKQGSFKQVTSSQAVKQDLIISAYKPKDSFKRKFLSHAGIEEAVWDFVRQHLEQLPKVVENNGKISVVAERQAYLLFDRMVAYHVMNGISVPMDAGEFYKGLKEKFIERDSMYFLPDQVNEYDEKRIKMEIENIQLSLLVTDEKTAIQWLYNQLSTPQTYQEIQPKFIQKLHQLKYEKMPELRDMLEENFLQDEEGKWYVPDVNKASDLAKLREKRLLKEFDEYLKGTGKLKVFRTESIRVGFDRAWKERNFKTIVQVSKRLPEKVIQEDPALLMYYDNALSKVEG